MNIPEKKRRARELLEKELADKGAVNLKRGELMIKLTYEVGMTTQLAHATLHRFWQEHDISNKKYPRKPVNLITRLLEAIWGK